MGHILHPLKSGANLPMDGQMPATAEVPIVAQRDPLPFALGYQVIERLGRGGMAEVFRAIGAGEDGRRAEVVLKRLRPELLADRRAVSLFDLESRLAPRMTHPNLVRGLGEAPTPEGTAIVFELVDGVDLARLLRSRRRPLPWPLAVTVARYVAAGLWFAHQMCDDHGLPMGLVHRDVTPSNVMIRRDGRVKLLDFGVAKLAASASTSQPGLSVHTGKLGYMAPEQLEGRPLDARADQYSLGVVLYEMLIGERLLCQPAPGTRSAPPPPSAQRADLPPEVDEIVLRLLAHDRAERFASCGAAAHAMSQLLYGLNVTPAELAALLPPRLS